MNWTDWATTLEKSVITSASTFIDFLPKLLGALVLVLLGYGLGKIVSFATNRVLGMTGLRCG